MVPVSLFYMPSYAWSDRMMKQKPKGKLILGKRYFFTYLGFIKDKFLFKTVSIPLFQNQALHKEKDFILQNNDIFNKSSIEKYNYLYKKH